MTSVQLLRCQSLGAFVTLVVITLDMVDGHQQCLDFRPPFEVSTPLEFCTEYATYGCCDRHMDEAIKREVYWFERYDDYWYEGNRLEPHPEELDFSKTLHCQRCSPYAAKLHENQDNPRYIGGWAVLCTDYCHELYDRFIALGVFTFDDSSGSGRYKRLSIADEAVTPTKDEFCNYMAVTDTIYCYPDVKMNPELNGNIDRDAVTVDGCLCLEPFADQLRNPLSFETPPDLSGRVFISEQVGVVHIYYKNGTKRDEQFMNISRDVLISNSSGDERGFLGLEFHPDFKNNGRLFVFYSIRNDPEPDKHTTRISEFTVSNSDPNLVNYTSERVILELPQPFANNNGGEVIYVNTH